MKIQTSNKTKVILLILILVLTNFQGCIQPPEQTELDPVFDVVIIAYEADTGNPLSGADVILMTDPYRTALTNSSGKVTFRGVQQHGIKLHLLIKKSVSNPEKYYYFESSQNGYPGGIDFEALPNHTFTVNVPNII